jgi:hypothetical protein
LGIFMQWSHRSKNVVFATVTALIAAVVVASPAEAASTPGDGAPGGPTSSLGLQNVQRAATVAAALAVARQFGHPVAVDAETTPTTQVSALPDGTMQLVSSSTPVRVKTLTGWVPVDSTLAPASDGFFAPAAANTPVEFSAGGSSVLARVRTRTGAWVAERSPFGVLPTPSVDGAVATYADVLPGVDLRLTATVEGMSEVLVIKTASAAANPLLAAVKFTVTGGALSSVGGGNSMASAADGSSVRSTAPTWWDSSDGSNASGPAGNASAEPVAQSTDGSSIALNAKAAASSRAITYPLYVDPDWTGGLAAYTYVDAAYPTQSYWDGQYATGEQRVGYVAAAYSPDARNHTARAFWDMDTSAVAGKHILNAVFSVTENGSFNCTASDVQLWWTGAIGTGTTWNAAPGWIQLLQDQSFAHGHSSACPTAAVGFTATPAVAGAAAASAGSVTLGLRAANEGINTSWKKFTQAGSLTITYNTPPNIPANPVFSSPSRVCGTATSPVALPGTQPISLQATVTDADAGTNVNAAFYVVNGTTLAAVSSYGWPQQAQGVATVTIPANTLGTGFYAWHADAGDGIDLSPGYSPYCYFNIVNTPPGVPGVVQTSTGTPVVGFPMTVSFTSTSSDGVAVYAYWWAPGAMASPSPAPPVTEVSLGSAIPASGAALGPVRYVRPDASSTNATGVIVAPVDRTSTLWVASYNAAGAVSQNTTGYAAAGLYVATSSDTTDVSFTAGHEWNTDQLTSPLVYSVADSNTTSANSYVGLGGDGEDPAATSEVLGAPASPVLSFPGYSQLNYWGDSTFTHDVPVLEGQTPPSGFVNKNHNNVGQVVTLSPAGAPSGTTTLYRCGTTPVFFPSTSATCEGTGTTAVPLGYIFSSATSAPSNLWTVQLWRCSSGGQYILSWYPTHGTTCGTNVGDVSLGWVADGLVPTEPYAPLIDATKSFTVSAWVNPASGLIAGRSYTAMSQQPLLEPGNNYASAFSLGIDGTGHSSMCLTPPGSAQTSDCATGPVLPPNTWSMITGVWDASNQQVRLMINDVASPVAVTPHVVPAAQTASPNTFLIGEGWTDNQPSSQWDGMIDDPAVFPGVIAANQLDNLYNQLPPQ